MSTAYQQKQEKQGLKNLKRNQSNPDFTNTDQIKQLEKLLVEIIEKEKGLNTLNAWKFACAISIEYENLGNRQLKMNMLEQAKVCFSRAWEMTDIKVKNSIWHTQMSWYNQRISIALSRSALLRKQEDLEGARNVLQQANLEASKSELYKELKYSVESHFDTVNFELAKIQIELKNYDEAIPLSKNVITIVEHFEKGHGQNKDKLNSLQQNQQQLPSVASLEDAKQEGQLPKHRPSQQQRSSYMMQLNQQVAMLAKKLVQEETLIQKKLIMKIHCLFMIGKAYKKLNADNKTLKYYQEAYKQACLVLGSQHFITEKYKIKYEAILKKLEFSKFVTKVVDFGQFQKDLQTVYSKQNSEESFKDSQKSAPGVTKQRLQKQQQQEEQQPLIVNAEADTDDQQQITQEQFKQQQWPPKWLEDVESKVKECFKTIYPNYTDAKIQVRKLGSPQANRRPVSSITQQGKQDNNNYLFDLGVESRPIPEQQPQQQEKLINIQNAQRNTQSATSLNKKHRNYSIQVTSPSSLQLQQQMKSQQQQYKLFHHPMPQNKHLRPQSHMQFANQMDDQHKLLQENQQGLDSNKQQLQQQNPNQVVIKVKRPLSVLLGNSSPVDPFYVKAFDQKFTSQLVQMNQVSSALTDLENYKQFIFENCPVIVDEQQQQQQCGEMPPEGGGVAKNGGKYSEQRSTQPGGQLNRNLSNFNIKSRPQTAGGGRTLMFKAKNNQGFFQRGKTQSELIQPFVHAPNNLIGSANTFTGKQNKGQVSSNPFVQQLAVDTSTASSTSLTKLMLQRPQSGVASSSKPPLRQFSRQSSQVGLPDKYEEDDAFIYHDPYKPKLYQKLTPQQLLQVKKTMMNQNQFGSLKQLQAGTFYNAVGTGKAQGVGGGDQASGLDPTQKKRQTLTASEIQQSSLFKTLNSISFISDHEDIQIQQQGVGIGGDQQSPEQLSQSLIALEKQQQIYQDEVNINLMQKKRNRKLTVIFSNKIKIIIALLQLYRRAALRIHGGQHSKDAPNQSMTTSVDFTTAQKNVSSPNGFQLSPNQQMQPPTSHFNPQQQQLSNSSNLYQQQQQQQQLQQVHMQNSLASSSGIQPPQAGGAVDSIQTVSPDKLSRVSSTAGKKVISRGSASYNEVNKFHFIHQQQQQQQQFLLPSGGGESSDQQLLRIENEGAGLGGAKLSDKDGGIGKRTNTGSITGSGGLINDMQNQNKEIVEEVPLYQEQLKRVKMIRKRFKKFFHEHDSEKVDYGYYFGLYQASIPFILQLQEIDVQISKPVLNSQLDMDHNMLITIFTKFLYRPAFRIYYLPISFLIVSDALEEFVDNNLMRTFSLIGGIYQLFLLYFDIAKCSQGFNRFIRSQEQAANESLHIYQEKELTSVGVGVMPGVGVGSGIGFGGAVTSHLNNPQSQQIRKSSDQLSELSDASSTYVSDINNLIYAFNYIISFQAIFMRKIIGPVVALRYFQNNSTSSDNHQSQQTINQSELPENNFETVNEKQFLTDKFLNYEANRKELAQFLRTRQMMVRRLAVKIEMMKPEVFEKIGLQSELENPLRQEYNQMAKQYFGSSLLAPEYEKKKVGKTSVGNNSTVMNGKSKNIKKKKKKLIIAESPVLLGIQQKPVEEQDKGREEEEEQKGEEGKRRKIKGEKDGEVDEQELKNIEEQLQASFQEFSTVKNHHPLNQSLLMKNQKKNDVPEQKDKILEAQQDQQLSMQIQQLQDPGSLSGIQEQRTSQGLLLSPKKSILKGSVQQKKKESKKKIDFSEGNTEVRGLSQAPGTANNIGSSGVIASNIQRLVVFNENNPMEWQQNNNGDQPQIIMGQTQAGPQHQQQLQLQQQLQQPQQTDFISDLEKKQQSQQTALPETQQNQNEFATGSNNLMQPELQEKEQAQQLQQLASKSSTGFITQLIQNIDPSSQMQGGGGYQDDKLGKQSIELSLMQSKNSLNVAKPDFRRTSRTSIEIHLRNNNAAGTMIGGRGTPGSLDPADSAGLWSQDSPSKIQKRNTMIEGSIRPSEYSGLAQQQQQQQQQQSTEEDNNSNKMNQAILLGPDSEHSSQQQFSIESLNVEKKGISLFGRNDGSKKLQTLTINPTNYYPSSVEGSQQAQLSSLQDTNNNMHERQRFSSLIPSQHQQQQQPQPFMQHRPSKFGNRQFLEEIPSMTSIVAGGSGVENTGEGSQPQQINSKNQENKKVDEQQGIDNYVQNDGEDAKSQSDASVAAEPQDQALDNSQYNYQFLNQIPERLRAKFEDLDCFYKQVVYQVQNIQIPDTSLNPFLDCEVFMTLVMRAEKQNFQQQLEQGTTLGPTTTTTLGKAAMAMINKNYYKGSKHSLLYATFEWKIKEEYRYMIDTLDDIQVTLKLFPKKSNKAIIVNNIALSTFIQCFLHDFIMDQEGSTNETPSTDSCELKSQRAHWDLPNVFRQHHFLYNLGFTRKQLIDIIKQIHSLFKVNDYNTNKFTTTSFSSILGKVNQFRSRTDQQPTRVGPSSPKMAEIEQDLSEDAYRDVELDKLVIIDLETARQLDQLVWIIQMTKIGNIRRLEGRPDPTSPTVKVQTQREYEEEMIQKRQQQEAEAMQQQPSTTIQAKKTVSIFGMAAKLIKAKRKQKNESISLIPADAPEFKYLFDLEKIAHERTITKGPSSSQINVGSEQINNNDNQDHFTVLQNYNSLFTLKKDKYFIEQIRSFKSGFLKNVKVIFKSSGGGGGIGGNDRQSFHQGLPNNQQQKDNSSSAVAVGRAALNQRNFPPLVLEDYDPNFDNYNDTNQGHQAYHTGSSLAGSLNQSRQRQQPQEDTDHEGEGENVNEGEGEEAMVQEEASSEHSQKRRKRQLSQLRQQQKQESSKVDHIQQSTVMASSSRGNEEEEVFAEILLYDPFNHSMDRVLVSGQQNLEKLVTILQLGQRTSSQMLSRVICMNLNRQKRVIGRKLLFRSFIETNAAVQDFQFQRKFNSRINDVLLKLLTSTGYLRERKNLKLFYQKVKLTLISSDINSEPAEQNFFLATYFNHTTLRQYSRIKNLGICLIQTAVYRASRLYTENDNILFIRIDVCPRNSRTKSHKFILDYSDIKRFICPDFDRELCSNPIHIYELVTVLCSKLVYFNTEHYTALKIPMQFITTDQNLHRYDLVNQFDINALNDNIGANVTTTEGNGDDGNAVKNAAGKSRGSQDSGGTPNAVGKGSTYYSGNFTPTPIMGILSGYVSTNQRQPVKGPEAFSEATNQLLHQQQRQPSYLLQGGVEQGLSMLTPVLRAVKVIYHAIKKVNNNYLVISVRRLNFVQHYYAIQVYLPKTRRQWVCYITPADFHMFDPEYLERLFPSVFWRHKFVIDEFENTQEKNYVQFCKKYQQDVSTPQDTIQRYSKVYKERLLQFEKTIEEQQQYYEQYIGRRQSKSYSQISIQSIASNISHQVNVLNRENRHNTKFVPNTSNILSHKYIPAATSQHSPSSNPSPQSEGTNKSQLFLKATNQQYNFSKFAPTFQKPTDDLLLIPSSTSFNPITYHEDPKLFMRIFKESQLETTQFFEIKIWEELVNSIEIKFNRQHNIILSLNTFQGILREFLMLNVVNFNRDINAHFEIFYSDIKERQLRSFNDHFPQLYMRRCFASPLLVRIKFFERQAVFNDHIPLRTAVYNYYYEESKRKNMRCNQQDDSQHPELYRFNLADLKNMALHLERKIKARYLAYSYLFSSDDFLDRRKYRALSLLKSFRDQPSPSSLRVNLSRQGASIEPQGINSGASFTPKSISPTIQLQKVNTNSAIASQTSSQGSLQRTGTAVSNALSEREEQSLRRDKDCPEQFKVNRKLFRKQFDWMEKRYLLLYRSLFTMSPTQMIAIFLKPNSKRFFLLIWNTGNCNFVIKTMKRSTVEMHIPYLKKMVTMGLYEQIGKRLLKSYKNMLMAEVYHDLNPETDQRLPADLYATK